MFSAWNWEAIWNCVSHRLTLDRIQPLISVPAGFPLKRISWINRPITTKQLLTSISSMKIRFNPNLYEITDSSVCFKMIRNNFRKNFFFVSHKILGPRLRLGDEEKLNLNEYLYRLCRLTTEKDSFHSKAQTRLNSGYTLWSLEIRLHATRCSPEKVYILMDFLGLENNLEIGIEPDTSFDLFIVF